MGERQFFTDEELTRLQRRLVKALDEWAWNEFGREEPRSELGLGAIAFDHPGVESWQPGTARYRITVGRYSGTP